MKAPEKKKAKLPAKKSPPAAEKSASSQSFIEFSCAEKKVTATLDGQVVGMLPLPGPWLVKPGPHTVVFRSGERIVKKMDVIVRTGAVESVACEGVKPLLDPSELAALKRYRWAPVTTSDIGSNRGCWLDFNWDWRLVRVGIERTQ